MEIHLTAMECHLPYGITQCYLPLDTSALEVYYENALYKFTFYITLHYITSEHTPPSPQPYRMVLDLPTI